MLIPPTGGKKGFEEIFYITLSIESLIKENDLQPVKQVCLWMNIWS